MNTPQYCVKISTEEANKEAIDYTKQELLLLAKEISESEFMNKSSSESDVEEDNNTLTIYKKNEEIAKLEREQHYKNLQISNLMLENEQLKENLEKIKTINNNINGLSTFITKLIETSDFIYGTNNFTIEIDENLPSITRKMIQLQKNNDIINDKINRLKLLNNRLDKTFVNYFNQDIDDLDKTNMDYYEENYGLLSKYVEKYNGNNYSSVYMMMIFILISYYIFLFM
jgi:hypothetical protein